LERIYSIGSSSRKRAATSFAGSSPTSLEEQTSHPSLVLGGISYEYPGSSSFQLPRNKTATRVMVRIIDISIYICE